jgi:hypothetical protein
MRKLLAIIAVALAGLALAGCSGERFSGSSSAESSSANSYAYEPPGSITRAPLSAPPGYGAQPGYDSQPGYGAQPGYGSGQSYGSPPPLGSPSAPPAYGNSQGYGSQAYGGAPDTAALGGWRASPRWSAVQGNDCIEVQQGGAAAPGAPSTQVRRCGGEAASNPAGTDDQAGYY